MPARLRVLSVVALASLWCGCETLRPSSSADAFDPDTIARDIGWLAADAREGRAVGTGGLKRAADYLAEGFRSAGLSPGGDGDGFLRSFEMSVSTEVADAVLRVGGRRFERGDDFEAFITSEDGRVKAPVVFAGYGISAGDQGYDDYAGLDVEGRIVLVLSDRPGGEVSPVAGHGSPAFLRRSYKFANARKQGAAAVLFAPSLRGAEDLAGNAGRESSNPTTKAGGIVSVGLNREAAEHIVAMGGADLAALQARIDETGKPASTPLDGVEATVAVEIERRSGTVANVIAVREGTDPQLHDEVVVIGAHYDALGDGRFGSLAPDRRGEVHNGADDNASGAAGLLALGRAFGSAPPGRRTLVLAAFTGEEAGLVGSAEYVRRPPFPLEDTVAMINLDMIGRLRDGKLIVFGVETSPEFPDLVARAAEGAPLTADLAEGGYSASDQTSFYARNVPVLFFFTGSHTQYHTPDDDVKYVNPEGTADVLRVVFRTARELLDADTRPEVVAAEPPKMGSGTGGGYGPYLGTIPDFGSSGDPGVALQGVRRHSPAETAGLRAGDRVVGFDGASVANLEEYAGLLYSTRPGQRVEIVVVRDGERLTFEAVLGQRR